MIGFQNGKCRLCGEDGMLNEGICGAHSLDAAQGYLFGYTDGLKEREITSEAGATFHLESESAKKDARIEELEAELEAINATREPRYRADGLGVNPCTCDRFEEGVRSHHRLCAALKGETQ